MASSSFALGSGEITRLPPVAHAPPVTSAITSGDTHFLTVFYSPDVMETWRHRGDIRGVSDWDFAAAERADAVTITGAAGAIRFSMFENAPFEIIRGGDILRRSIAHPVPIQLHDVAAINAHLRNGPTHPSTGDSALRTAWATDTILRGPATEIVGFRLYRPD